MWKSLRKSIILKNLETNHLFLLGSQRRSNKLWYFCGFHNFIECRLNATAIFQIIFFKISNICLPIWIISLIVRLETALIILIYKLYYFFCSLIYKTIQFHPIYVIRLCLKFHHFGNFFFLYFIMTRFYYQLFKLYFLLIC